MRRTCVTVLLALVLVTGLAAPVAAGEHTTTTAVDSPRIIPRPNEGQAPSEAGDRGGALQYVVMGLVGLGVAVGATLVIRESRRSRRSQGRA